MLKEIYLKLQAMPISETRQSNEDVIELVFNARDLTAWNVCLESILGAPVKPAGASPEKEDKQITQNFGGVRSNQTLFHKQTDGLDIIAMLWPWQSGENITLKVFALRP
jgi:hypothetical protein